MRSVYYDISINWLFNQFPAFQKVGSSAYKPTLENTLNLIRYFDLDLDKLTFVHVAGTNGKGTTCSIIASASTESGYKTGLFTSPHIHDFKERIRIDGYKIEEDYVVDFITTVQSINWEIKPSFFEITWVLALKYFIDKKCDLVIAETGLGGRLDATNVISPLVTAITNIGLDHINILGATKAAIAKEKAGIIKYNTPVFIGTEDQEVVSVFNAFAKSNQAPITLIKTNSLSNFDKNKSLARGVTNFLNEKGFAISDHNFSEGITNLKVNTGLRGRFEVLLKEPLIIADAAHNVDGIKSLLIQVRKEYPKKNIALLYGASNDKDLNQIFKLFPESADCFLTQLKNARSFSKEELRIISEKYNFNKYFFSDAATALKAAQASLNKDAMLLVFGSFFLLEEII